MALEADMRARGQESRLSHGRQLLIAAARPLVEAMKVDVAIQCAEPTAGQYHAGFTLLPLFRRPEHAALIALRVVVDHITGGDQFNALAARLGRLLEQEVLGQQMARNKPTLFRHLKRRHTKRSALVREQVQKVVGGTREPWTRGEQVQIGALMLVLIERHTSLIEIRQENVGGKTVKMVRPTQEAMALIKACRPASWSVPRGAMVCPPRPWRGLEGGGALAGDGRLVRGWAHPDQFEGADLARTLQVVNTLQRQQLAIDRRQVELVRQAWEAGGLGLFKVTAEPPALPHKPEPDAPRDVWDRHNREAAAAHHDRRENAGRRLRVERGIQALEEIEGPCWFAHDLDDRGRVYTTNRVGTHQGQDYEKGAIGFAAAQPLDVDGFEWLLRAAANHWGERGAWAERLQWGRDNLELMREVAWSPLELAHLWRQAKDPWQFLQAARAIDSWLEDPSRPIGCPVRLDQTTSGCGIIAALLRDARLGRECNLHGSTRHDLYQLVAERVERALQWQLQTGDRRAHRLAQLWLGHGIDRKLLKGPVLALPYGGRMQGTTDAMAKALEERQGWVQLWEYENRITQPAIWLARVIHQVMGEELATPQAFLQWTRALGAAVIKQQQAIQWTSPMGFPLRQGKRTPVLRRLTTELFGVQRMTLTVDETPPDGELSLRQTNGALAANIIHSFDAAFCHAIVCRAAEHGQPLLTNHDCFASLPGAAGWLQRQLLDTMREMHKTPWLGQMVKEVKARTGITAIPSPPMVGSLSPGLIGSNEYLFS
jgi:DNA-directed RNA polymerase